MDKNTKDILEVVNFLKDKVVYMSENMVTKDELSYGLSDLRSEMETGFRELRAENLAIIQKLDALTETVDGMKGYTKEIDELRNRVNAVELKLQKALG